MPLSTLLFQKPKTILDPRPTREAPDFNEELPASDKLFSSAPVAQAIDQVAVPLMPPVDPLVAKEQEKNKPGILNQIGRALPYGTAMTAEGIGGAMEWLGPDNIAKPVQDFARTAQDFYAPIGEPTITEHVASAVGSSLPLLAGGFIGGMSKAPALARLAVPTVAESATEAGHDFLEAKKEGMDEGVAATKSFLLNLPTIALTNKLSGLFEGDAGIIRKIVGGAIGEGIQEGSQQAVSNFALRRPVMEGVPQAAAIGALAGPVIGGSVRAAELADMGLSRLFAGKQPGVAQVSAQPKEQVIEKLPEPEMDPKTDFGRQLQEQMKAAENIPLHPAKDARAELADIYDNKEVRKAQILKKAVSALPDEELADLKNVRDQILEGEPGRREPVETLEGQKWIGIPSTYPAYFRNKGYTKKAVLNILDKAEKGAELTEKQRAVYDDILTGYRAELEREIVNAEQRAKRSAEASQAVPKGNVEGFEQPSAEGVISFAQEAGQIEEDPQRDRVKKFKTVVEAVKFVDEYESSGKRVMRVDMDEDTGETLIYLAEKSAPYGNGSQPTFYSKLEKSIESKMPNAATPEQVRGILKSEGVKQEEIDWTDVEEFIKDKPKVTKAELLDYVRQNNVQIEEKKLSNKKVDEKLNKLKEAADFAKIQKRDLERALGDVQIYMSGIPQQWGYKDDSGKFVPLKEMHQRGMDDVQERISAYEDYQEQLGDEYFSDAPAKFAQFQLPGGKNYREVLLKLPDRLSSIPDSKYRVEVVRYDDGEEKYFAVTPNYRSQAFKTRSEAEQHLSRRPRFEQEADVESQRFRSSHFDDPNILAHVRLNDRTDADGNKVLFVEEVQSDWHQKGRKDGYQKDITDEREKRYLELDRKMSEGKFTEAEQSEYDELYDELWDKYRDNVGADDSLSAVIQGNKSGVPDAPFKKTWHELAMKRILRMAAEEGYDRVAWTTGEQQAERYDLSKQVDKIEWSNHPSTDTKLVKIKINNNPRNIYLFVDKNTGNVVKTLYNNEESLIGKGLDDIVGKEIASKINREFSGDLSGDGLKVGGEGMKGFYDQILPSFMNKYAKKWGGRVESTNIDTGIRTIESGEGGRKRLGERKQFLERVHSIDITPSMRQSVMMEGQALFEPNEQYSFLDTLTNPKNSGKLGSEREIAGESKKISDTERGPVVGFRGQQAPIFKSPFALQYKETGYLSFPNKKVTSPADIAFAFQFLKDEAVENFFIGTIKDQRVQSVELITQGAINFAAPGVFEMFSLPNKDAADSVFFVHNHPSGNVNRSADDIIFTNRAKKMLKLAGFDFAGHVIINTEEFGFIDKDGNFSKDRHEEFAKVKKVPVLKKYLEWLGKKDFGPKMSSAGDIYEVMKGIQIDTKDSFLLFGLNSNNQIMSIEPLSDFDNTKEIIRIMSSKRATGAIIVGTRPVVGANIQNLKDSLGDSGIRILDYIFGSTDDSGAFKNFISFADKGLLRESKSVYGNEDIGHNKKKEILGEAQAKYLDSKEPPTPSREMKSFEGSFELPPETKFEAFRRVIEDHNYRAKVLNRKISEIAGDVREAFDLWMLKDILPRKQSDAIRRVRDEKVDFVKQLVADGVSVDELDVYLHARHARERNARINRVRAEQNKPPLPAPSGMTDEEAAAILRKADPKLEKYLPIVRKLENDLLDFMVSEGLLKAEDSEKIRSTYSHHVPLFRDLGDDYTGIGMGVDIRGKEVKRAKGSDKRVISPIANIFYSKEKAVVRALKNKIGQTIIRMTNEYPFLQDFFKVSRQQYTPRYNDQGELEFMDPKIKLADNVIGAKIDGNQYFIEVKDELLAKALKNVGLYRVPRFMAAMRGMLSVWSGFKTRWRPEFVITNFERDLGEALLNLGVEKSELKDGKGLRLSIVKNIPSAQKRIWKHLRKKQTDGAFDEFLALGGDTGHFWVESALKAEESLKGLEVQIKDVGAKEKAFNAGKAALQFIDDVNSMVELGVRFSTYEELVKRGFSKQKAIQSAADLTVNFSRQGEISPWLKSFYGFINPSIQGTSKVIRSMSSERGRSKVIKGAIGLVAMGFFVRLMSMLMNDDEDERIPEWTKNHKITFALPGGGYVNLWALPYGYTAFFSMGSNLAEILYKKKTNAEGLKSTLGTAVNSFSPFETDLNSIIPTLAEPLFEIKQNEGWYGGRIHPEQIYTKTPKPNSQTFFKRADGWAIFTAQTINKLTGGNSVRSGLVDVHPDDLEYLYNQYFGGPFEFVTSTIESGARGAKGEFDPDKTPFVRQFYRNGRVETFAYGVIHETLQRAGRKEISTLEKDRFFRAIDLGVSEGIMDQKAADSNVQDFLRAVYGISGPVNSPEAVSIIQNMPEDDRKRLLETYSQRTRVSVSRGGRQRNRVSSLFDSKPDSSKRSSGSAAYLFK